MRKSTEGNSIWANLKRAAEALVKKVIQIRTTAEAWSTTTSSHLAAHFRSAQKGLGTRREKQSKEAYQKRTLTADCALATQ
ncbi:MAG TPA: hypothetical protein DIS66_03620 [Candidatus Omnitrophica bacterium]|nr:hypothetical protein [Candidatus Omnitrophota bacterium]